MAEYLTPLNTQPKQTGAQDVNYYVKLLEEATLQQAQNAANAYLILARDSGEAEALHLMNIAYHYLPKTNPPDSIPERHVMSLTFRVVGVSAAFIPP